MYHGGYDDCLLIFVTFRNMSAFEEIKCCRFLMLLCLKYGLFFLKKTISWNLSLLGKQEEGDIPSILQNKYVFLVQPATCCFPLLTKEWDLFF